MLLEVKDIKELHIVDEVDAKEYNKLRKELINIPAEVTEVIKLLGEDIMVMMENINFRVVNIEKYNYEMSDFEATIDFEEGKPFTVIEELGQGILYIDVRTLGDFIKKDEVMMVKDLVFNCSLADSIERGDLVMMYDEVHWKGVVYSKEDVEELVTNQLTEWEGALDVTAEDIPVLGKFILPWELEASVLAIATMGNVYNLQPNELIHEIINKFVIDTWTDVRYNTDEDGKCAISILSKGAGTPVPEIKEYLEALFMCDLDQLNTPNTEA